LIYRDVFIVFADLTANHKDPRTNSLFFAIYLYLGVDVLLIRGHSDSPTRTDISLPECYLSLKSFLWTTTLYAIVIIKTIIN